jgi:octaprenyl-diphosphate synthase
VGKLDQSDADLARAVALVAARGGIRDTLARARHFGQRAKDSLDGLPDNQAKAILLDTVDFAVARNF